MGYYSGLFSGVGYISYPVDHARSGITQEYFEARLAECESLLNGFVSNQATDSIVNITYVPNIYFGGNNLDPYYQDINIVVPNDVGGYSPRNKKLFTYPYRFLLVDTLDDTRIYKYELFRVKGTKTIGNVDFKTVPFRNTAYLSAIPAIMSVPKYYSTLLTTSEYAENSSMGISLRNFPQLAMTVDSFRAYVANGSLLSSVLNLGQSATRLGLGVASENPALAISGGLGMAETVNSTVHAMTKGDVARGAQNGAPYVASRKYNFYYKKMCIRPEYARMIDGYFDRFGYATNQLKVPNTHVRENWTYTKTDRCTIVGSLPVDDMNKICSIYDKGITFWNNPYAVGNYSLSNRCLSEIPPSP